MNGDSKYTGPINPGHPVKCETPGCGATYVPQTYELSTQTCPRCGR